VGSANQNMPGLFTSWIQKYPDPFYVFSVTDAGFFDPGVPALRTGGVPPSGRIALIGSDGSPAAYQRIRTGEYEIGTIPEPASATSTDTTPESTAVSTGDVVSLKVPKVPSPAMAAVAPSTPSVATMRAAVTRALVVRCASMVT